MRQYAGSLALNPAFTVLDRADSADLMDVVRGDLGFAGARSRFPKKGTCLAIYSYTVNAGFRALQLLPGIGPASAKKAIAYLGEHRFDLAELTGFVPPAAAAQAWPELCRLLRVLHNGAIAWTGQTGAVRAWYQPHLERLYDYAAARAGDLEQLEQIAMGHSSRERFLSELALEQPDASGTKSDGLCRCSPPGNSSMQMPMMRTPREIGLSKAHY